MSAADLTVLPEVRCPVCHKCLLEGLYLIIVKKCDRCGHWFRHALSLENFDDIARLLTNAIKTLPLQKSLSRP
jgi:uncharacterized protein (DUF983 family)